MNAHRFFWGLIIVLLGLLWLLSNFGLLPGNFWYEIWRLWPLLLIMWGLSLLFGKEGKGSIVFSIIMIVVLAAAIALFSWVYRTAKISDSNITTISESISAGATEGELDVNFGAAKLNINDSSDKFVEGTVESFSSANIAKKDLGAKETVVVDQATEGGFVWGIHNGKNELNLKLSGTIPLALNLNTGASTFDLDLRKNKITNINIECGASNGDIKLGSLSDQVSISISSGASSFNIKIPNGYAIRVVDKSGLSGNNFASIGLQKNGDIWESVEFDNAQKKIEFVFLAGASNLNIEQY